MRLDQDRRCRLTPSATTLRRAIRGQHLFRRPPAGHVPLPSDRRLRHRVRRRLGPHVLQRNRCHSYQGSKTMNSAKELTQGAHRPAFSLIELIVVIGIIALLAGILMPALTLARERANQVKCMATLRAIGQAAQSHAAEHASYMPTCGWQWNPAG